MSIRLPLLLFLVALLSNVQRAVGLFTCLPLRRLGMQRWGRSGELDEAGLAKLARDLDVHPRDLDGALGQISKQFEDEEEQRKKTRSTLPVPLETPLPDPWEDPEIAAILKQQGINVEDLFVVQQQVTNGGIKRHSSKKRPTSESATMDDQVECNP